MKEMAPFNGFTKRTDKRQSTLGPRRLGVESLENRDMMAGVAGFAFNPYSGVLTITETATHDTVDVTASYGVSLRCSAPAGTNGVVTGNALVQGTVKKIVFLGNDGNDTFRNNTNIPCEARGGLGNDFLQGGGNNDLLLWPITPIAGYL